MTLQFQGLSCPILGIGGSGVVVLRHGVAVKLPKSYLGGQCDDHDDVIQREKEVYVRLMKCDGIVPHVDLSGPGIEMAWMENGSLHDYITRHSVSRRQKMSWFRDMALHLQSIHDYRVIVADIGIRNFLIAKDMSVKFCDFTESSLMNLDCDMQEADDNGYSIHTDIGQLGAVMYEVITGRSCDFDLFRDQPPGPASASWPRRQNLPNTQDIWLGSIIESCWTKGAFRNSLELASALQQQSDLFVQPEECADQAERWDDTGTTETFNRF